MIRIDSWYRTPQLETKLNVILSIQVLTLLHSLPRLPVFFGSNGIAPISSGDKNRLVIVSTSGEKKHLFPNISETEKNP